MITTLVRNKMDLFGFHCSDTGPSPASCESSASSQTSESISPSVLNNDSQPMPDLRDCERVKACVTVQIDAAETVTNVFLSCSDVMRELGSRSSVKYVRQKMKSCAGAHGLALSEMEAGWEWSAGTWQKLKRAGAKELMMCASDLSNAVRWMLSSRRMTRAEKASAMRRIGLDADSDEVRCNQVPVELLLIEALERVCPFRVIRQFGVGKYRLDAYMERPRLAIQIDEQGHRGYDAEDERDMEDQLREMGIVLLRYNPDSRDPLNTESVVDDFIQRVWAKVCSPDMVAYWARAACSPA